jgi:hypothetical protein
LSNNNSKKGTNITRLTKEKITVNIEKIINQKMNFL